MTAARPSRDNAEVCRCCGGTRTDSIYQVDNIPVQSCILLDSSEEALAFPRHSIDLRFCEDCGFIFNAAFEERLLDYASATEESQHFSATFGRFASELIDGIMQRYDLSGRTVVEIGCGKGDFLRELCARSNAVGIGIDPGYVPGRNDGIGRQVRFIRDYFDPEQIEAPPALVVCRHTLEHIAPVAKFVADILEIARGRQDVVFFFETPDVGRVLAEGAFWDIYFEHCSYFSIGTHARLSRRAGMNVTELRLAYNGQYIIQFAEPSNGQWPSPLDAEDDLTSLRELARDLPTRIGRVGDRWRDLVETRHRSGDRLAVWGGGSKAVAFLTTLGISAEISTIVDINPFKQNKFLPGSAHRVVAPDALASEPPGQVIVMNPIYVSEVRARLDEMGLKPEVLTV